MFIYIQHFNAVDISYMHLYFKYCYKINVAYDMYKEGQASIISAKTL